MHWYEFFFNDIPTSSFTSQEVRTFGIFEISFITTEIHIITFVQKIIKKFGEIAPLEKKFKLDFSNIYHSYFLK